MEIDQKDLGETLDSRYDDLRKERARTAAR
jgi:hypothetical protein